MAADASFHGNWRVDVSSRAFPKEGGSIGDGSYRSRRTGCARLVAGFSFRAGVAADSGIDVAGGDKEIGDPCTATGAGGCSEAGCPGNTGIGAVGGANVGGAFNAAGATIGTGKGAGTNGAGGAGVVNSRIGGSGVSWTGGSNLAARLAGISGAGVGFGGGGGGSGSSRGGSEPRAGVDGGSA
jgi:hypothetical protein